MCLAMAACGTNPDEKTDAEPVSITVTENWDFSVGFYPVITPMVSSTYGAGFWSRNFYNTLVSYDDNGKIQGELAETWEISDDGKTYTFHLRDGVKFSDGTPLTSEAVKMTLEAVVTHLGPQNGAFGTLVPLIDMEGLQIRRLPVRAHQPGLDLQSPFQLRRQCFPTFRSSA